MNIRKIACNMCLSATKNATLLATALKPTHVKYLFCWGTVKLGYRKNANCVDILFCQFKNVRNGHLHICEELFIYLDIDTAQFQSHSQCQIENKEKIQYSRNN